MFFFASVFAPVLLKKKFLTSLVSNTGPYRQSLLSQLGTKLVEADGGQVVRRFLSLLHAALNISDRLPPSQMDDVGDAQLALSSSIKLRLERDPNERKLQQFPGHMVLIDPLAPIQVGCSAQKGLGEDAGDVCGQHFPKALTQHPLPPSSSFFSNSCLATGH